MSEQDLVGTFILSKLREQHAKFSLQRDQTQINFQQLVGAVYACEVMIKQHEEELKKQFEENIEKKTVSNQEPKSEKENQGAIDDGKANEQPAE